MGVGVGATQDSCSNEHELLEEYSVDPRFVRLVHEESGLTLFCRDGVVRRVEAFKMEFLLKEGSTSEIKAGDSPSRIFRLLGNPHEILVFRGNKIFIYDFSELDLRLEIEIVQVESYKLFGVPLASSPVVGAFHLSKISTSEEDGYSSQKEHP